jgi:hypothetical protein
MPAHLPEHHRSTRIGWLRAAVMGANDGIVSTASLVLGVAGAGADRHAVMVAGVAGLVAGAMSMAAGKYVSVSSQSDTEAADLKRERTELAENDAHERAELAAIYVGRGLDPSLAKQVAQQPMAHDALGAHARDELGISDLQRARPVRAAFASGRHLLDRCRDALARGPAHRRRHAGPHGHRRVPRGPGDARVGRRPRRRRERPDRRTAGHLLGRARDGAHLGRGPALRGDRVAGADPVHAIDPAA